MDKAMKLKILMNIISQRLKKILKSNLIYKKKIKLIF